MNFQTTHRYKPNRWIFLTTLVFLIHVGWNYYFRLDAPVGDDIGAIFHNLVSYYGSNDFVSKFVSMLEPNAEHRMLATRLFALLSVNSLAYLSIKFLYLISCVLILGIVIIICYRKNNDFSICSFDGFIASAFLFLPVYDSVGAVENANSSSVFFAFVALLFLPGNSMPRFLAFQFFSFITLFTQGNGLLMIPIGALYFLFFDGKINTGKMLFHFIFSIAFLDLYFHHFSDEALRQRYDFNYDLMRQFYTLFFEHIGIGILQFFIILFVWMGQWLVLSVDYSKNMLPIAITISFLCGLAVFVSIVYFFVLYRKKINRKHAVRILMLVYMLLTIAGAAWSRSLMASWLTHSVLSFDEMGFVLSARYALYPICLFIVALSLVLDWHKEDAPDSNLSQRRGSYPIAFMLFVVALTGYRYVYAYPYQMKDRAHIEKCIVLWNTYGQAKPCLWHSDNGATLKAAETLGLVKFQ